MATSSSFDVVCNVQSIPISCRSKFCKTCWRGLRALPYWQREIKSSWIVVEALCAPDTTRRGPMSWKMAYLARLSPHSIIDRSIDSLELFGLRHLLFAFHFRHNCKGKTDWATIVSIQLALSRPYGPLLARSGYPGQNASSCNNLMVMICATVNALTLL